MQAIPAQYLELRKRPDLGSAAPILLNVRLKETENLRVYVYGQFHASMIFL